MSAHGAQARISSGMPLRGTVAGRPSALAAVS
jgi:hypothetical protein